MPHTLTSEKLFEIIQREEFLAFFAFRQPQGMGAELSGLVKVARPADEDSIHPINYLSLTFIFDTQTESHFMAAKNLAGSLTAAGFSRHIPDVRLVTSVPATAFPGPHYIHQLDLVFNGPLPKDTALLVSQVASAVRQLLGVSSEPPQFWDDADDAPAKSTAEKANFTARIKALFSMLGKAR